MLEPYILVILQVAALLTWLAHASHAVFHAANDSFACRLAAPRII